MGFKIVLVQTLTPPILMNVCRFAERKEEIYIYFRQLRLFKFTGQNHSKFLFTISSKPLDTQGNHSNELRMTFDGE